ncbi:MAG TPA: hypothetical protein VGW38_09750 [Chloroflexota bacterium]|nr:hypothetical protein [Chloroflexota bacterium]
MMAVVCSWCDQRYRHFYLHVWLRAERAVIVALRAAGHTSDALCPECKDTYFPKRDVPALPLTDEAFTQEVQALLEANKMPLLLTLEPPEIITVHGARVTEADANNPFPECWPCMRRRHTPVKDTP